MNPKPRLYLVSSADKDKVVGSILSIWNEARKEYYKFEGYSDLFEESDAKWVKEYLILNLSANEDGGLHLNMDCIGYIFNPLESKDDLTHGLDMVLINSLYLMFCTSVKKPMSVAV